MISVIIITLNEEKHIARCIESVAWADEVIVLDSGSKDNTIAIAKSLGAKVVETNWPGYGLQKQRALELATCEWVLSLDADEYLDVNAAELIQKQIQTSKMSAFKLPIRMVFQNAIMKFANSDNKHIRLFRKDAACFSPDKVHEKVILNPSAECGFIPAIILHESYEDWHDALHKMNLYSSLSAQTKSSPLHKPQNKILRALGSSIWLFVRNYIFKLWCLDGREGFLLAVYQAQGSWYRYIKQMYPNAAN
jgi:glycosyltransferase involved in cell wall biosynthesis